MKEQYFKMLVEQKGCCAICKKGETHPEQTFLSIDHCHKTGKVRGLLCSKCNAGIGFLQDSPINAFEAYKYLLKTSE